jgi:hypothetical protein
MSEWKSGGRAGEMFGLRISYLEKPGCDGIEVAKYWDVDP